MKQRIPLYVSVYPFYYGDVIRIIWMNFPNYQKHTYLGYREIYMPESHRYYENFAEVKCRLNWYLKLTGKQWKNQEG